LPSGRITLAAVVLQMAWAPPATSQQAAIEPDSAPAQIRAVLRAFYLHLDNQNWEALSGYVLSPKLLERKGAPGELQTVTRNRTRGHGSSHMASKPKTCPVNRSAFVDEAVIRLDGDWAEASVPRCSRNSAGVDELRLLYFEERWRFIYTDLFEGSSTAER
jgi:hypothetical protein